MKISLGSARLQQWTRRLAAGAAVFGLGGCDADVRDTLVTGTENAVVDLATAFINAFFTGLLSDDTTSTTTTVKVVFDELVRWMA